MFAHPKNGVRLALLHFDWWTMFDLNIYFKAQQCKPDTGMCKHASLTPLFEKKGIFGGEERICECMVLYFCPKLFMIWFLVERGEDGNGKKGETIQYQG